MLTSSRFFAPRGMTLGHVLSTVAPSVPIAITAVSACASTRARGIVQQLTVRHH
jgi:hypothetical protein